MSNFTLASLYNALDVITSDASTGNFPRNSSVSFANEGLRRVKRNGFDLPSREHVGQMAVMTGIYRYAALPGMEDIITISEQGLLPDNLSFSRKDETVFWRDFPGSANTFAIARNKIIKTLLVNLCSIKLSTLQIDGTSSLTTQGTWALVSGTDSTNLGIDSLHFPASRSGIKFDIDINQSVANSAAVEKINLTTVDLSGSAVVQSGKATLEFFWPSSTLPTSVTYRFGSSSSDYYEITVTAQIDGQPFVQGLNQLGFDWQDVAPTGAPNNAAIDYERFSVAFPSSLSVDVLGVAFSNIVMREKKFVDVHFLSDYLVMDEDGVTLKSAFDDQNDTASYLIVDETFWDWLVYHTAEQLFSFYEPDNNKLQRVMMLKQELEEGIALKAPSRRAAPEQTWMDTQDLQTYMN